MGRKTSRTALVLCCVLALLGSSRSACVMRVCAQPPLGTFSLGQARNMALTNSSGYRKAKNRLILQDVKYQQALKSIALKKKNQATFRWMPLLTFQLPEKADLADEAEYLYKPLQIQSETTAIRHSLTDIRYQVQEEVSGLYVTLYTEQERIAFYEKRMEERNVALQRNRARLLAGEAGQADVDFLEKAILELETKLAAELRNFERDKTKMAEMTGLDVTTGCRFDNPYVDAVIERQELARITQHTVENDQQLYEAKLDEAAGLAMLNSNYGLMRNQYGARMNRIDTYINQAKRGEKLDADSFKRQYDALLADVDQPWQGKFRILFFRFPREWLKGQISGVRYVEDDPYLLYTNALDYQEALESRRQIEKELKQSVRDGFENLVTVRNSYQALHGQTEELEQEVLRGSNLNLAGEMNFEELAELQEELEEAKLDRLDALSTYSKTLYAYDRLTCGAITALLTGAGETMGGITEGISYVTEEAAEGACYYIHTKIEDQVFDLGIYIPEEYEIELTDYELWCDDVQVGERTPVDRTIRHLLLDMKEVERVWIRFYDGDDFVDDCVIDPQEYSGPLAVIMS